MRQKGEMTRKRTKMRQGGGGAENDEEEDAEEEEGGGDISDIIDRDPLIFCYSCTTQLTEETCSPKWNNSTH